MQRVRSTCAQHLSVRGTCAIRVLRRSRAGGSQCPLLSLQDGAVLEAAEAAMKCPSMTRRPRLSAESAALIVRRIIVTSVQA